MVHVHVHANTYVRTTVPLDNFPEEEEEHKEEKREGREGKKDTHTLPRAPPTTCSERCQGKGETGGEVRRRVRNRRGQEVRE